jgi:hypothetical protein
VWEGEGGAEDEGEDEEDPFVGGVGVGDVDALLAAARPTDSVVVCAAVYLARLDAVAVPLCVDNAAAVAAAALAAAALVVDRGNVGRTTARVAAAAAVSGPELARLASTLVGLLPQSEGPYISVGVFREFEELLDNMM